MVTQCDACLPACLTCSKAGVACASFDDVLQEEISRSYIKNLYDRVDELKALLAANESSSPAGGSRTEVERGHNLQYMVPSRARQYLFLGPSPPVLIGNATFAHLLGQAIQIASPLDTSSGTEQKDSCGAPCSLDKQSLTASTASTLVAHYIRCIEPVYPASTRVLQDTGTALRQNSDFERCKALLVCATAALQLRCTIVYMGLNGSW
jgi:hypothetical protein